MFAEEKCSRGHLSRRDKLFALMVLCGASGDVEQVVPSPGEAPRTPAGASVGRECMKGLQRFQGSCVIQAAYSQEQDDAAKPFLGNVTVP